MYNKLFTKILDSSIWLAPDPHRLVWITLLAAMDEDSNAMFASVKNLAARARVSVKAAEAAIVAFENPDPDSGDPDHEGRRVERFPGGWHVLNGQKYRDMVTKTVIREQTRLRVQRHRERARNAAVTPCRTQVTPSEARSRAEAEAKADTKTKRKRASASQSVSVSDLVAEGVEAQHAADWIAARRVKHLPLTPTAWDATKAEAMKAGISVPEAIRMAASNGWAGFKASWVDRGGDRTYVGKQAGLEARNAAVLAKFIKEKANASE